MKSIILLIAGLVMIFILISGGVGSADNKCRVKYGKDYELLYSRNLNLCVNKNNGELKGLPKD